MNYWLLKSEPTAYSIDDLKRDKRTAWEGVRNYQARNYMNEIQKGDRALFYHSGSGQKNNLKGVFGVAKIAAAAHPDESQFKKGDYHYDPKSTREKPLWHCVDVAFVKKFKSPVLLGAIKSDPALAGIMVAARGSRLSVQPVSEKHFEHIVEEGSR